MLDLLVELIQRKQLLAHRHACGQKVDILHVCVYKCVLTMLGCLSFDSFTVVVVEVQFQKIVGVSMYQFLSNVSS